ncbi:hypothetical protein CCP3SC15_2150007 [Gammaproteobacteria bacterium]
MRKLKDEFFQNKIEQGKIKSALWEAMPVNVYYHNLIIALAEMLLRCIELAYKDEVHNKPTLTKYTQ